MQPALTPLEQQQINVADAASPTFWHRVRFELVRRHAHRTGAGRVLDVGAGSGLLGDHLASSSITYRFTESSAPLRSELIARFGAGAEHDVGDRITADTVVAVLDVIEHVVDDVDLLKGLHARMDPGAQLVITVPAMRWLFSSWDRDLGHHRRYSRADCRAVVARAGFDVVEATYLFPELVPIALLRRFRRSDTSAAEFPRLPMWIDRAGFVVSSATTAGRRISPIGTSVLVAARRSGSAA
jgi:hypothetical protein